MKPGQYFALTIGIIYLMLGIMGFIPNLVTTPANAATNLGLNSGFGYLFGLFPINSLENIVHVVIGILGIGAALDLGSSRLYAGALGLFYGVLTIMGLIPVANTTFGLIPIYGNDIWLHGLTAAIAVYFGFIASPDLLELSTEE